jgi:hypothetical protein
METALKFLPVVESEKMNEYARLAVKRHILLCEVPERLPIKEDTEPLWDIEDKMSNSWQHLNEAERQAVSGLTSDLSWIRRNGELAPKQVLEPIIELENGLEEDPYRTLHFMRICLPLLGKKRVATGRAAIYQKVFGGVASQVFKDFAETF